jgi:aldehyde dehydrogenase
MQYASQNLIPVTLELGGKSRTLLEMERTTNLDKASRVRDVRFNQGEVCTCPSRVLSGVIAKTLSPLVERTRQMGHP